MKLHMFAKLGKANLFTDPTCILQISKMPDCFKTELFKISGPYLNEDARKTILSLTFT